MKEKKSFLIIAAFILLNSCSLVAQKDNDVSPKDTINASILQDYTEKLAEFDQQRKSDSILKAELEAQLSTLKTSDNLKKEELLKELQDIQDKENKRLQIKKARIDSLRATARAFPVTGFHGDTLFLIYSRQGSFSPAERANAISERIQKLSGQIRPGQDSLKIVEAETNYDIVSGEDIIMTVSENDALWNNTSKFELAEKYRKVISDSVIIYQEERKLARILLKIAMALLVILVAGTLIFFTRKLFRWTALKIQLQEGKYLKGIRIRNYLLFDARREVKVSLAINLIVKWFIFLLIFYISFPILFGIFPRTKNVAEKLFSLILDPVKKIAVALWDYLPNLITIIVIVIVFRYVLKGIRFLKTEVESGKLQLPGFYPDWANPTYQIIRILLFAFFLVVIFPYLPGSDSPVFKGVSVFLGFLFTFGSAGSLSNIIAGIVLTYMRIFKIGDRVKIGDVTGDVIEKSVLVTRIRTIKNEIISIPNSTVMSSHTINYSSDAPEKGLIIHTTVTIGYDVPWRDMHQALIDAALKTEWILNDPMPFVLQTSLDDFYVSYQVNAYTKEPNRQAVIYSNLHQNIQDICNERGIEILSPHYRAERDGNMTTIPSGYLPKDYKAPSFTIKMDKDKEQIK